MLCTAKRFDTIVGTREFAMYTNVNLAAPVGVLLLLGTGLVLFVAGLGFVYSVLKKKFGLTKFALISIALVAGLYLVCLLIFSFASSEKVLARGEENTSVRSIAIWPIPSPTCARRKSCGLRLIS